jgi:hypothetical protein
MSIGSLQPLAPGSHSKIRRILASQRRTPARKSSNGVQSPRLEMKRLVAFICDEPFLFR